jgi:hypothetical protein
MQVINKKSTQGNSPDGRITAGKGALGMVFIRRGENV